MGYVLLSLLLPYARAATDNLLRFVRRQGLGLGLLTNLASCPSRYRV